MTESRKNATPSQNSTFPSIPSIECHKKYLVPITAEDTQRGVKHSSSKIDNEH